jgi:3-phosphoshikimate 1-carboxyvinyltransferase
MRAGLRALGVLIDDNDDPWMVLGTGGKLRAPDAPVDAGASGTTARFLTAASVLADGPVTIDGTPRMRRRPIGHLLEALAAMGAEVASEAGFPPVRITPAPLHGGVIPVDATVSSQFLSAVLMVAPMVGETVIVAPVGGEIVSRPYVVSTLEVMGAFGADVEDKGDRFVVVPTGYRKTHYEVEADASAAAYPLVAAAITGGMVAVGGIHRASTQADLALIEVLVGMGCTVRREERRLTLAGPAGPLWAIDVDMNKAPDAVLALAVACLFADGPSRIRNVGTLRVKETDRLEALRTEIVRLGGGAEIEGDDLIVKPAELHGARVETYDDHRMAMSFALVGLKVPGVEIVDPGCVAKTWPTFFEMLETL